MVPLSGNSGSWQPSYMFLQCRSAIVRESLIMAPGSAESCMKENVSLSCLLLMHEKLITLVEFEIVHGRCNIKNKLKPKF